MRVTFRHGDLAHEIDVVPGANGSFTVTVDGAPLTLVATCGPRGLVTLADGAGERVAYVSREGARRFVTVPGVGEAVLERVEGGRSAARHHESGSLTSPMPGKVVAVRVAEGDVVTTGQILAIVEAMKMEMPITAPHAGRVLRVAATVGTLCDATEPLIELAPREEDGG